MAQDKIALAFENFRKEDLERTGLALFNNRWTKLIEAVNRLAGNHGPVALNDEVKATAVTSGTSKWTSGVGNPNGRVAGHIGDLYTRTDGGAGATLYVKESMASGLTNGWTAK